MYKDLPRKLVLRMDIWIALLSQASFHQRASWLYSPWDIRGGFAEQFCCFLQVVVGSFCASVGLMVIFIGALHAKQLGITTVVKWDLGDCPYVQAHLMTLQSCIRDKEDITCVICYSSMPLLRDCPKNISVTSRILSLFIAGSASLYH